MDNQNDTPTNKLFCAGCQAVTDQTSYTDQNGEHVFVCTVCERAIKLPAGTTPENAVNYWKDHADQNKGQVSLEDEIKLHSDITDALSNVDFTETVPTDPSEEASVTETPVDESAPAQPTE